MSNVNAVMQVLHDHGFSVAEMENIVAHELVSDVTDVLSVADIEVLCRDCTPEALYRFARSHASHNLLTPTHTSVIREMVKVYPPMGLCIDWSMGVYEHRGDRIMTKAFTEHPGVGFSNAVYAYATSCLRK